MPADPNPNANKPFLASNLSAILNYSATQSAATFTVETPASGTTVKVSGITGNPLSLGSYITDPSGVKIGAVVKVGTITDLAGNGTYVLDVSFSSVSTKSAKVDLFETTVQNAFQTLLNNPIPSNSSVGNTQYYKFIYSLVKAVNIQNDLYPSIAYDNDPAASANIDYTSGKNGIRILATMDDGTPIVDTGKCVSTATTTNQITSLVGSFVPTLGNTYVNFSKKITILNANYSSSNTVTDASNNSVTLGTAGGNAINENHHTRPEFLLALFSSSSNGSATRWSSSTNANNIYLAQRMGFTPEANFGAIRINVPVTYA
jgi:hypothetical protein